MVKAQQPHGLSPARQILGLNQTPEAQLIFRNLTSRPWLEIAFDWVYFDEGYERVAYRCTSNKLTVGIGRNIEENPLTKEEQELIGVNTARPRFMWIDEAGLLTANYLLNLYRELLVIMPWIFELDNIRKAAIINMAFQMGIPRLLKFKNTLRFIQNGNHIRAAQGIKLSLYYIQTHKRAKRVAYALLTGDLHPVFKEWRIAQIKNGLKELKDPRNVNVQPH